MSFETIRINELAKELGLTSKEVLDKFAKISVTGKTHSSTVTMEQVKKLKDFIASGGVKEHKKPKAFVVKKAKPAEKPVVNEVEIKKEEPKTEPAKKASVPKVEIVKPKQPQSRLEIVRRAPRKPVGENAASTDRPERPSRNGERKFPPRGERTSRGERPEKGERNFPPRSKDGAAKKPFEKPSGERKPIQRTIISQDIYENKGNGRRRTDGKKKGKDFNNKKEEQERISLEKAAAQKHKKRSHKEEEAKQVTQVVVNRAMTISELSEKFNILQLKLLNS